MTRRRMDHTRVCGALGPYVPISGAAWEKRLVCNRVAGHPGQHQHRAPETFTVMAEWAGAIEPEDERDRRAVKPEIPAK